MSQSSSADRTLGTDNVDSTNDEIVPSTGVETVLKHRQDAQALKGLERKEMLTHLLAMFAPYIRYACILE